jgi:superfamily II DNA or RNA helicase
MDGSDSDSEAALVHVPDDVDIDELLERKNEIIEDLAGEEDDLLSSDKSSLASLTLSDGTPSIKPRAYQVEMLEESLKHNIIVAADTGSGKTHI